MTTYICHIKMFYAVHRRLLIGLLLVMATFIVYRPLQYNDFVSFDDNIYVTENRHVQEGLTSEGLLWAFTTIHAANWHPLTWISHMLDCELFGLNPAGHHLTNLLFHLGNILLLFFILEQMTGRMWRSAFVAALFALHPLHVESVAWVAERKDVLSTFLGMLSLLAYHRYAKQPRLANYLLVFCLFSLGLMAKPMLVTFPFIFLLLDFWPLKRFELDNYSIGSGGKETVPEVDDKMKLIWEKVPFLVPMMISSVFTLKAQFSSGAGVSLEAFMLKTRVANALVAYVSYVIKAIWPVNLSVFYPHPGNLLPWWQAVVSMVLISAACFGAIRTAKTYPYILVGVLWYLGTLLPVIGLVQVGQQAMADRYTYIPMIGLFITVAWGVPELASRLVLGKIWLNITAAIVISVLMTFSWQQVQYWKNSITLFEHSIKVTSNNYHLHYNLGVELVKEGRINDAIHHYLEVLRMRPDHYKAQNNLGIALIIKGDIKGAVDHFKEALRIKPDHENAIKNLRKLMENQK